MNGASVSAAIDKFLEWDMKRTTAVGHLAEAARLDAVAANKCGNCRHWMTRQCPREANVNGHRHGPSSGGFPCNIFAEDTGAFGPRQWRDAAASERAKAAALLVELAAPISTDTKGTTK